MATKTYVTCDRCGEEIEHQEYTIQIIKRLPIGYSRVGEFDLCKKCAKQVLNLEVHFWEEKP